MKQARVGGGRRQNVSEILLVATTCVNSRVISLDFDSYSRSPNNLLTESVA